MKTTKKDFQEFKKWITYYQDMFNLKNFRITCFHGHDDAPSDSFAAIWYDVRVGAADVVFCSDYDSQSAKILNIRRVAKHEMVHLLLSEIVHLAREYNTPENLLEKEGEHVCRILECIDF